MKTEMVFELGNDRFITLDSEDLRMHNGLGEILEDEGPSNPEVNVISIDPMVMWIDNTTSPIQTKRMCGLVVIQTKSGSNPKPPDETWEGWIAPSVEDLIEDELKERIQIKWILVR